MKKLTLSILIKEAKDFCERESLVNHKSLIGVTDGKAVGTYVEHKFLSHLGESYQFEKGNSASGIDIPDKEIETDIKVTSIKQPQSSCPFKSASQKIYGLGYNLLVFVYDKVDTVNSCILSFKYCSFIEKHRTGDFTITKRLIEMVKDGANAEDIKDFLRDRQLPGDEITYEQLAKKILGNPPVQGYLTVSNALQWRLQYQRVIMLTDSLEGIVSYGWN